MKIMHKYKKRYRIAIGISTALLLAVLAGGTWNSLRPLPPATASAKVIAATPGNTPNLAWPAVGQAAVGAPGFGVLATHGAQTPQPTASVAKVITALAVLERKPLKVGEQGPIFTLSDADVAIYNNYVAIDGSVARVSAGEQLSEYQALQAMLLPSANNIADSMAGWVFGSLADYRTYAAAMVTRLGMNATTIGTDASGLSPSTTSTASDLVLLGEAAMQNPVLAQIVSQTTAVLPVAGTVHNVNWLLGQDNVVGIKTGNTDDAGGCFLGASTHTLTNGTQTTVITAIMGSSVLNTALAATPPLINTVKPNLNVVTPITAGQVLGSYTFPWGGTGKVVAKKSLSLTAWYGDSLVTHVTLQHISHPYKKGAPLGTATLTAGRQHASVEVVAQQDSPVPSWWWRVTRH